VHELSVAAYLLEAVSEQARQNGARRVTAINLVVGERAGIVAESLRFAFDLLAADGVAAGAALNLRQTPMCFHCDACAADYTPAEAVFACPRCGQYGRVVDDGSALRIESLEVQS
jgi:hydrogenase nickel incorporation protein HypA/HybF